MVRTVRQVATVKSGALLLLAAAVAVCTLVSCDDISVVGEPGVGESLREETPSPSVQITLASTDLAMGPNRLAFGLVDVESGPIREADVLISTFYLGGGRQEGPIEQARAIWRRWPIAQAGCTPPMWILTERGPGA